MNANVGTVWRFLLVEDDDILAQQVEEAAQNLFVDAPDTVKVQRCAKFKDAKERLSNDKFDLLILDLKDDSITGIAEHDVSAGMEIFDFLKRTRFSPVVFHTAHAHQVSNLTTSFVRVVEKTVGLEKLVEEVRRLLDTQLPALSRRIEEIQRAYMWDFVDKHWKDYDKEHEKADLAYLMARRLASTLQADARLLAKKVLQEAVPASTTGTIHPMEMYVHPPVGDQRQAGDLVKGIVGGEDGLWLVLTPSCDFEQKGRLQNVLLARCVPLAEEPEFKSWANKEENAEAKLKSLIADNRQKSQSDRYKFLPGTFFLPDSVVDFQRVKTVTPDELANLKCLASLDSPYAEAVLARFSRYFGRLGTLDIDKQVVLRRLEAATQGLDTQKAATHAQ